MKRNLLALACSIVLAIPARGEEILVGGRIQDPDGKPLRGATVELIPIPSSFLAKELQLQGKAGPEPAVKAVSDADGRFEITAPGPGMWRVRMTASDFLPHDQPLLPLLGPEELPGSRVERGVPLRVRIVDPQGRPLAGVHVTPDSWADAGRPALLLLTGDDGTAAIPRSKGARIRLSALAAGYPAVTLDVEPSRTTAELRLAPGCERIVEVVDRERRPAEGAIVSAGPWALGSTDAAGRLAVFVPCDGELRVTAETRDGRRAEATLRRAAAEAPPFRLALPAQPARLTGRVVTEGGGEPVAGALVWPSDDPAGFVRTDAKGTYVVAAPAAELGGLAAAAAGHLPAQEQVPAVQDSSGTRAGPTLALHPTASIAGTVVDEAGRPVAGAVLRGMPDGRPEPGWQRGAPLFARSGAQGRFRLRVALGQAYTLVASHPDFTAASLPLAALAPRASRPALRIVLAKGQSAFGRVVDANQRPVAGARVSLAPATDEREPFRFAAYLEPPPPVVTDAEGRFALEHLRPGRFDLEAGARGFAPTFVRGLTVPESKEAFDLGTVVLHPGVALEGRVMDPRERPVAGASIYAMSGTWPRFSRRGPGEHEVLTAADGTFTVPDLRPGERIRLSVSKQGYAQASFDEIEVPGAEPLRIVLTPGVRVAGRVLDEAGEPVSGAFVTLTRIGTQVLGGDYLPEQYLGSAPTSEDGRFALSGIEPGKVRLVAAGRGFLETEIPGLEIPSGRDLEDVELVLKRGAAVMGRVLRPDGAPVTGARVQVVQDSDRPSPSRASGGATTDGDGNYRLEGVAEGQRSIAVHAEGFQRAVRDLEVRPGENRLDFRLEAGHDVAGRVVDASGEAIEGARVGLDPREAMPSFRSTRGVTRSAADGSFRLRGVEPGVYRLQAEKEGYAPAHLDSVRVAGMVQGLELRLETGGSVRGRLLGLEPSELAEVRVTASTRDAHPHGFPNAKVDYQGGYRIDGLAVGEWHVWATAGSNLQASGNVAIAPGTEAVLDLEFRRGGLTLSGRVLRAGEPVPNVRVMVRRRDGSGSGSASTDPQGAFRIEGLEAGTYELQATQFEGGLHHQETVEISASRDVLIEIATRRVSGWVVDAEDRTPLAGVVVALEKIEKKPGDRPVPARGSASDGEGAFTVTDVAPGSYRVTARKEGYAPAETTVQVGDMADADDVLLALEPTQGLTFEAHSTAGNPAEVQAVLLDASGRAVVSGSYPTGENGRVRMPSAPPGSWRLLVTAPGSATAAQAVQVPGPTARLVLYPAASLTVAVPALEGTGHRAAITITGADGQPFRSLRWSFVEQEWRAHEGRALIEGLPPGRWHVRATAPDGKTWQATVTTAAGGRSEVVLR